MALQVCEHTAAATEGTGVEKGGKGDPCAPGVPGDIVGRDKSLRASQVPRHCSSKASPP